MSELALTLGFLLVIFGPVLLIPITWILYRLATRPILQSLLHQRLPPRKLRLTAWAVAILAVAVILTASYIPGKLAFNRTCAEHGTPQINLRVQAEGFFRNKLFLYEAHPYLDTFSYVEAPDPYHKGVTVRYTRVDGKIQSEEVTELRSRYAVRKQFSELPHGIYLTEKQVYELSTNRELARAANISYHGGPLSLLLGSSVTSSCPDILSDTGSEHFKQFYDLENIVLRVDD